MVAGYAIGGGHVLHLICDLTIAANNAVFGQTVPVVGSFDGGYGAGYMTRIVGQKKAREIWFLCQKYDAQAGLISPLQMRLGFVLAFFLASLLGLYLIYHGGWPILLIGVLSPGAGFLYTAGPYPLAYLGLGDPFVLIFFRPVAVAGTYYLQTYSINKNVLIAGLAPGLISTAILDVNNEIGTVSSTKKTYSLLNMEQLEDIIIK